MKKLFCLLLLLSFPAFAADDSSWYSFIFDFIDWVKSIFADVETFFSTSLPGLLTRITASGFEVYMLWKLKAMYYMVMFAYEVAKQISTDLQLSQYLSSAVSGLPSNVQYTLNSWQIPNCINFIMNCFLTRFVMNVMGW